MASQLICLVMRCSSFVASSGDMASSALQSVRNLVQGGLLSGGVDGKPYVCKGLHLSPANQELLCHLLLKPLGVRVEDANNQNIANIAKRCPSKFSSGVNMLKLFLLKKMWERMHFTQKISLKKFH